MRWNTFKNGTLRLGLLALLLLLPFTAYGQQPIVYGLFFYSPTCPHCHEVLDNHWPAIQGEFGDQLQVLFVDVSVQQGSEIMAAARDAMGIRSFGVPMLIIGSDVMVGAVDIPTRAPQIIRSGLAAGGIGLPPIPNIEPLFETVLGTDIVFTTAGAGSFNLFSDPANGAAIIVLGALILSLGLMIAAGWSAFARRSGILLDRLNVDAGRRMVLVAALGGVGLAASLVFGSPDNLLVPLLALGILAIFLLLAVKIIRTPALHSLPNNVILFTAIAGLVVAGYLAYIEITQTEAVCGVVGDCNTVQQSIYARIAGIPVGVLGIVGYLAILGLWMMKQLRPAAWIDTALFACALFGVVFSIYLTFLEPFVIGATCVWCLMSAVLMLILLWLTAPAGWDSLVTTLEPTRNRSRAT